MTISQHTVTLTPCEYLQREEQATSKNEYCAGVLFPTAGRTTNHNRIAVSTCTVLDSTLEIGRYIDQYRLHVDHYHRIASGRWLLTELEQEKDVITLEPINVEMPLRQIYRRVDWTLTAETESFNKTQSIAK